MARDNPAYLGRRQQHLSFEASTSLRLPQEPGVAAGIAAFQNGQHWCFLGARRAGEAVQVFLEKQSGATATANCGCYVEASQPRLTSS